MREPVGNASGRGARLLEQVAVRYLTARARRETARVDPRVHLLDDSEREALLRIERGAIFRSALAGALSSLVVALAEIWADTFIAPGTEGGLLEHGRYWGVVMGVTIGAAAVEILYLYRDALVSVQRMAHCAGLPLADVNPGDASWPVAVALARAALEVPSPPERLLGIDPYRESSRWRLVLASVLYKAKIALTTVLLKVVLRRVLSRAALRWVLPFVGVPVTALWNALITYRVTKEARLRAMGPSSAMEVCARVFDVEGERETRVMMLRAVASCVVRTRDLHPNLRFLLLEIHKRLGKEIPADPDNTEEFLRRLRELPPTEQVHVVEMLCYAAIIDGRITRQERRLILEASAATGLSGRLEHAEVLRSRFLAGDPLEGP
jgi:hypothetical protein